MAKILTYTDLQNFFADIARRNKLLNPENAPASSRFHSFTEQILTRDVPFPCMILMPDNYTVSDSGDNTHLFTQVEFWISEACPPQTDAATERVILDRILNLSWEILSEVDRMYRHHNGNATTRPMSQMDRNSIRFEQHAPFGPHNAIGYRVQFQFGVARAMAINPANWYS
jgi:hypothetical protein